MKDQYKTKKQLIEELEVLRDQLVESKKTEANGKRAETALRESQERFKIAAQSAGDLIWEWDIPTGRLEWFGPIDELLGYAPNEFPRTIEAWEKTIHPDDRDRVMAALDQHLKGRTPYNEEYRVRLKDRTYRYWTDRGTAQRDSEGNPLKMVGACTDITEHKQAEARTEHLKFVLLAIRGVNQLITREKDRDRLIQGACDKLIEMRGYDNVWITLIDESGKVAATAEAGLGKSFLPLVEQLGRSEPPYCMRMALTQAGVLIIEDPFATCADCPLSNGYGGRSAMAIRLEHDGKIYGLMTVSVSGDYVADEEEQTLFAEVAEDIAFAFYSIELEEKHRQAEEAVRESEERFRKLVETMKVGLSAIDEKGVLTYINEYFSRMLGYTIDEMIGCSTLDFYYDEESRKIQEEIFAKRRIGMRDPTPYEVTWRKKDGQKVYSILSPTPSFDANGRYTGSFAIHTDITERKQAEKELHESKKFLQVIFDGIQDGISVLDRNLTITQFNKWIEKMHHKDMPLIGKKCYEVYQKRKTVCPWCPSTKALSTGKVHVEDVRVPLDDGSFWWCELSAYPLRGENDVVVGVIEHVKDITERKRAEEALQESEERFRLAFDNANTGVCLVDLEGNLTKVNNKMCEIFGYTKEDLEHMTVNDIAHPEDINKSPAFIQRTLRGETDRGTFEKRYLHKKGHAVACQVSSSLVRNADGSPLCFISHVHDITEHKRAEEESEVLREQLRQSQKMEAIGRLAGGIAHDFNNLLTIIKGYSQLSLIELKEDSPLKKNIEHIHGATDRAANLVRQLLAFSRRQILEMKVLDLNAILTNLDNMLRRVIGEDIELITILAEDLGRVKTDPGWIEQAIMNLVVNSRDAMPSGGKLTIETGNADLDEAYTCGHVGVEPGRYVMLSVSDTGVGITPEVMEQLFEPFFSTKEKDKGTGLGLSTVYGIVKQSDGDICVYSEPGKGATFKIYLPRVDEPLEERREKVLGDELLRGSETILLVEDEENVRKLALRVLERQGYKVLSARDGDDALLICEQFKDPIHLMLTDVVMPGMSGHELAKRLKSLHPKMKVLYMSGYTDDTIVLHGVLVEGVNYIQKPFTVDALTKKVREVLEQ